MSKTKATKTSQLALKAYKTHPSAQLPAYGTEQSACFDLRACFKRDEVSQATVKAYTTNNTEIQLPVYPMENAIQVPPQSRVLIPTGLIFDIPGGYSIRVHPRSGLAIKQGLTLINCEGVIDSDYVQEVYITLYNASSMPALLKDGDRLCQAELVKDTRVEIEELSEAPVQKTDRDGGFGSTGIN